MSLVSNSIDKVKVKLDTRYVRSKSIEVTSAVAINNKNNYKVKLSTPIVVKVCGSKTVIKALTSSKLSAVVDLDGKALGEQTIPVTINSNVKDNVWQYGTYDAKVIISK